MRILVIGSDITQFNTQSPAARRSASYAELVDELHIISFAKRGSVSKIPISLGKNAWVYSTDSFNRWFYIYDAIRIGAQILKSRPDGEWVVSTQDPFESGFVGVMLQYFYRASLHVQIHTDFLSPYFCVGSVLNRFRLILARVSLPRARSVRVVSQRIADSVRARGLVKQSPIRVLPIPVDASGIGVEEPTTNLHKEYPRFDKILLTVCRLSPEKDIVTALHVLQEVLKHMPRVGLIIVGDGSLRDYLKSYTASLDLSDHVVFAGWHEDVTSYYRTADLFLFTSLYEGYGLVLIEAALSGCPIVTTDVGSVGDVLSVDGDVLVCMPRDRRCLSTAVLKTLSSKHDRKVSRDAVTAKLMGWDEYLNGLRRSWEDAL